MMDGNEYAKPSPFQTPTPPHNLPTSPSNPYHIVTTTLTKTLNDLQTRSIVSSTLHSLISDVELTHTVNATVQNDQSLQDLEKRCVRAECALEEYRAMERREIVEKRHLAGNFVTELLGVSAYLEELEEWKRENGGEEMSGVEVVGENHGDGGDCKDGDDGDDCRDGSREETISEIPSSNLKTDDDVCRDESKVTQIQEESNEAITTNEKLPAASSGEAVYNEICTPTSNGAGSTSTHTTDNELQLPATTATITEGLSSNSVVATTAQPTPKLESTTSKSISPVAENSNSNSVVPQTMEEEPANFQSMDGDILMKVFEFADAIDILNVAQANVILYSKIDSIFGLGGSVVVSSPSRKERVTETSNATNPPPVTILENEVINAEQQKLQVGAMTTLTTSSTVNPSIPPTDSNSTSSASKTTTNDVMPSATMVAMPPPKQTPRTNTSSTATASIPKTSTTTTTLGQSRSTSSIASSNHSSSSNQRTKSNKKQEGSNSTNNDSAVPMIPSSSSFSTTTSLEESGPTPPKPDTTTTTTTTPSYRMDPSVANSLAAKLSPTELTAIITMRDGLRRKDIELTQLQNDSGDLAAQLVGIVNVKEILTSKVQELRVALDRGNEDAIKVARQTSSDQEVIAFLDERVQELEKSVDRLEGERVGVEGRTERVRSGMEKQVRVMKDMLTFERDQSGGLEKEWKAKKKVLIKEVKNCRLQILTLEAERDGFREENLKMKEALRSIGIGSSRNSSNSKDKR